MREVRRAFRKLKTGVRELANVMGGIPRIVRNDLSADKIADLVGTASPLLLEIGCNDGRDTEQFLKAMPGAKVHCFEPDARAAERFAARLAGDGRVHLHRVAVGATAGEMDFYPSGGAKRGQSFEWDLSGSIRRPVNSLASHEWIQFGEATKVRSVRLDDWCDENGVDRIDFIWMDVQGAEQDVIEGGRRALSRTRFVYTEYSNEQLYEGQLSLRELLKLLPEFRIVKRYPHDILLRGPAL